VLLVEPQELLGPLTPLELLGLMRPLELIGLLALGLLA
jgi:hypothetical protein